MMHGVNGTISYSLPDEFVPSKIRYEISGRNTLSDKPENLAITYINLNTGFRMQVAPDSESLSPEVREALPAFIRVNFDDQQPDKNLTFIVEQDILLNYRNQNK